MFLYTFCRFNLARRFKSFVTGLFIIDYWNGFLCFEKYESIIKKKRKRRSATLSLSLFFFRCLKKFNIISCVRFSFSSFSGSVAVYLSESLFFLLLLQQFVFFPSCSAPYYEHQHFFAPHLESYPHKHTPKKKEKKRPCYGSYQF